VAWSRLFGDCDCAARVALSPTYWKMKNKFLILPFCVVLCSLFFTGIVCASDTITIINGGSFGVSFLNGAQGKIYNTAGGSLSRGSVYQSGGLGTLSAGANRTWSVENITPSSGYVYEIVSIPFYWYVGTTMYTNVVISGAEYGPAHSYTLTITPGGGSIPSADTRNTNGSLFLMHFQNKDGTKSTRFIKLKHK